MRSWSIRTPRVYRFLEKQFVDDFFRTGALQLSSFQKFGEHSDEQRLDDKEGKTHLIHRTSANGGQTLHMEVDYGADAYVLCGSMAPSKELMATFKRDSAIVITDTTWFGREVSKKIPQFKGGLEGPCSYQYRRIVEKDLGWLAFPPGEDGRTPDPNDPLVQHAYNELNTKDGFFLKRENFRHQVEYRFVWLSGAPIQSTLHILVPDARRYCVPWDDQGTLVAF